MLRTSRLLRLRQVICSLPLTACLAASSAASMR